MSLKYKKTTILRVAIFSLAVLLFLINVYISLTKDVIVIPYERDAYERYNGSFTIYQYGDEIYNYDNSKEEQIYLRHRENIYLETLLHSDRVYNDPALAFSSNGFLFDLYQDDRLIYSTTSNNYVGGSINHVIPLSPSYEGSKLKIVITEFIDGVKKLSLSPAYIGNELSIVRNIRLNDLSLFITSLCFIELSILWIIFSLLFKMSEGRVRICSFAFLINSTAIYLILQTNTIYYFVSNPNIIRDLFMLISYFMPLSAIKFIKYSLFEEKRNDMLKHVERITYLLLICYFITLILVSFFSYSYNSILIRVFSETLFFLFYLLSAICILREINKSLKDRRFMALTTAIYLLTIVVKQIVTQFFFSIIILRYIFALQFISLFFILTKSILSSFSKSSSSEKKEELLNLSYTDTLTGLLNRTAFENYLTTIDLYKKHDYFVFCIDIDSMKECNDTYGHSAGDILITSFSKAAYNLINSQDSACFRIGGDEFVLLLVKKDDLDPKEFMKTLIQRFNELNPYKDFSFSYGCSLYEKSGELSIKEVYKKTDEILLFNKSIAHSNAILRHGGSNVDPKSSSLLK